MERDDLRVLVDIDYRGNSPRQEPRPVSDAELAEMGYVPAEGFLTKDVLEAWAKGDGYVKVPDCEACEGTGTVTEADSWGPNECPSCAGSGKGRLVNLTGIDWVNEWPEGHQLIASMAPYWNLTDWLSEGKPELQGSPEQIISEAWDVIDYLAKQYDGLRTRVLAALDKGETDV